MENKKNLITILAALVLCSLFYAKIALGFTNKFLEYGNDTLIVILLLAFGEQILLLIFLAPFALYQKLSTLVNSTSNKNEKTINHSM